MHTYSFEVNQLKLTIESKLKHSYLENFIQKPLISLDKIYIYNNIYSFTNTSWDIKEKMITTIFLVEIALNTHELVPNHQSNGEMGATELQLSVLAGDYYSSQYYYILSQLENTKMISSLANAIKVTSENKMRLFYNDVDSINEFFTIMKENEGLFYEIIASELQQSQVISIIKEYFLLNKLMNEKQMIKQGKQTTLLNYLETAKFNVENSSPFSIIDQQIDKSLHEIDKLLMELPYQYAELKVFLTNKLHLDFETNRSIAEEG